MFSATPPTTPRPQTWTERALEPLLQFGENNAARLSMLFTNALSQTLCNPEPPAEYKSLLAALQVCLEKPTPINLCAIEIEINLCLQLERQGQGLKDRVPQQFFIEIITLRTEIQKFLPLRQTLSSEDLEPEAQKLTDTILKTKVLLEQTLESVTGVLAKLTHNIQDPEGPVQQLIETVYNQIRAKVAAEFGAPAKEVPVAAAPTKELTAKTTPIKAAPKKEPTLKATPAKASPIKKKEKFLSQETSSSSASSASSFSDSEEEPTSSSSPSAFSFDYLELQGKKCLSALAHFGGNAFACQGAKMVLSLFIEAFGYLKRETTKDAAKQPLLLPLDHLIKKLKKAHEQGSWNVLKKAINLGLEFLKDNPISINGVRLPLQPRSPDPSAIPDFFAHIEQHRTARKAQAPAQAISNEMVHAKATVLQKMASVLTPLQFIGKLVAIDIDKLIERKLFRIDPKAKTDQLAIIFQERVFAAIDRCKSNRLLKWSAKLVYRPIHALSSFYTRAIVKNLVKRGLKLIREDKHHPHAKQDWTIDVLLEAMGNLNSAYDEVATTKPKYVEPLDTMMEAALKKPKRNGGFTQRELYAEAINKVLTLFGPKIAWNRSIETFMRKKIPNTSYFRLFQTIVNPFQWIIGWGLKILIFIPQWLGNKCLQLGAKVALNRTSIVEHYMDRKMEETEDNTATSFAIQTMLYHQMQNALTLLNTKLKETTPQETYPFRKKTRLRGLVKHVLEIINKGTCDIHPELKRLYEEKKLSFREWAYLEAEKNVRPEIVEQTMLALAIRLESMTKESELKQMLYELLHIGTESFTPQKPPSESDFVTLQGSITELNDQMIETIVRNAIDTQLDFTNTKQIEELKTYLQEFKQNIHTFYEDLQRNCRELYRNPTLSAKEVHATVEQLLRYSEKFNKSCITALQNVYSQNSHCNADTVARLNAMNKELHTHCAPIDETLDQMQESAEHMLCHDNIHSLCNKAQRTLDEIGMALKDPLPKEKTLEICRTKIKALEDLASSFEEHDAVLSLLTPYCKQMLQLVAKLSKKSAVHHLLERLQRQITDVPKRKQSSEEEAVCLRTIAQLPSHYHNKLTTTLNRYVNGKISQQNALLFIQQFQDELQAEALQEKAKRSPSHKELRIEFEGLKQQKEQYLRDNQGHLRDHLTAISKSASELLKWTDRQEGPTLWNILYFDTTWISEALKTFAINRGKEKSRSAIESMFHKYNNSFFLNQLLLLPLINSKKL